MLHEDDVEVRNVGVDGHRVIAKRCVGDSSGSRVGNRLFQQCLADSADGAADGLTAGQFLVENAPPIYDGENARHACHAEVGVDANLYEFRRECAGQGDLVLNWRFGFSVRCELIEVVASEDVGVALVGALTNSHSFTNE